jgi:hypothetical protein
MAALLACCPKPGCCSRCCRTLRKMFFELLLVLLNCADLVAGTLLVAFSAWLGGQSHVQLTSPAMYLLPLATGGALVTSAVVALVATFADHPCAAGALRLSAVLAVPIGAVALASGGFMLAGEGQLYAYARAHSDSDAAEKTLEKNFSAVAAGLFALSALQLGRFGVCRALAALARGDDDAKARNRGDEEDARAAKVAERTERIRNKWADKRKALKAEYSRAGDIQGDDGARDALMNARESA